MKRFRGEIQEAGSVTASDPNATSVPSPVTVLDVALLRLRVLRPPGYGFAVRLETFAGLNPWGSPQWGGEVEGEGIGKG